MTVEQLLEATYVETCIVLGTFASHSAGSVSCAGNVMVSRPSRTSKLLTLLTQDQGQLEVCLWIVRQEMPSPRFVGSKARNSSAFLQITSNHKTKQLDIYSDTSKLMGSAFESLLILLYLQPRLASFFALDFCRKDCWRNTQMCTWFQQFITDDNAASIVQTCGWRT